MIGNIFKVLISIKAKLLFGFLAMTVIIGLLGGYAYYSTNNAKKVVENTFDQPLMAINFARSASQVFSQLEIEVLRQIERSEGKIVFDVDGVESLLSRFKDDLEVAKERSISSRAESFFIAIDKDIALWEELLVQQNETLTEEQFKEALALSDRIVENLDIVAELQTGESFLARERAVTTMEQITRYNIWAVIAALTMALILALWIAVTIIYPLKSAAIAARKISAGNFNVDIPPGGDDETGVLLKSMAVMQDNIRERMGREQDSRALAQSRLADSLDNSKDAILLTDKDGVITLANPRLSEIFLALEGKDLIGKTFGQYFDDHGALLSDGAIYNHKRQEIELPDGKWARVSASQTREGGRLYIWNDITESKNYALWLKEAKEQAEAANKAKTEFLAAMSHELRTPLNAVIGFSDVIHTYHSGPDGVADHAELASLISKSGAQLLNIVQDVLSVAQGQDSEGMNVEIGMVNLCDAIDYAVKTVRAESDLNNIRVLWTRPAEPYIVPGDVIRIRQLLLNLLSNGVKFNRVGGIVKVKLSKASNNQARIDIIDSGIGIAPEDQQRILEPFIQVDTGHSRQYDGVGLGLSIVKQIADAHDAKLLIGSQLGKGTVVSTLWPSLDLSATQQAG